MQPNLTIPRFIQPTGLASLAQGREKFPSTRFQGAGLGIGRLISTVQLQQLGIDTGNVLVPKFPFMRSKAQLFEEVFLELVEDLAFYFTVPLAGALLAKVFASKALTGGSEKVTSEKIGLRLGKEATKVSKELLGAKAGTLIGAITLAAGFEYMIQHVKNVITAKQFHIANFTAVAGLEKGRTQLKAGEDDPVAKAKRRGWQTTLFVLGGLGAAFLAPLLIRKSGGKLAGRILQYIDFGSKKAPFDLSRVGLALVIGSGVASYLDAARDSLERKETGTRLLFVVPGLLFGKALADNLLAWGFERFIKVGSGEHRKTIRKHLEEISTEKDKVSFLTGEKWWKKAVKPDTFLEFGVKADGDKLFKKLVDSNLSDDAQRGIIRKFESINFPWSYLVSAGIFGSGVCWLAFKQTRKRFEEKQKQEATRQNLQKPTFSDAIRPQQPFPASFAAANRTAFQASPFNASPFAPAAAAGR